MAKKRTATMIQQSRRIPASQKAEWHAVTGAGRSHVIRDFFGLSGQEEQQIENEIGRSLDVNLQRSQG
jgi:hypothetical protein